MHLHLELLRDELTAALAGLDERQTQLRPAGGDERWNIQQIVGHLTLTYAATSEAMDARLARGSATMATPSLMQRVAQVGLIRVGYFPRGRKAPERVVPRDAQPKPSAHLRACINDELQEMDSKTTAAEALFGRRRRAISHMILGPLSADQWRRFHLVHGRHHIKQIRAIRRGHGI